MERRSSINVTTLPGLLAVGLVVVEIFFIHLVASRDHMFKGFCNFVIVER